MFPGWNVPFCLIEISQTMEEEKKGKSSHRHAKGSYGKPIAAVVLTFGPCKIGRFVKLSKPSRYGQDRFMIVACGLIITILRDRSQRGDRKREKW
jgi:hypothetical protein